MKTWTLGMVCAGMALLAGCTSVESAQKFNGLPVGEKRSAPPAAHLNVSMSGLYLFHCLPVFTGSVGTVGKTAVFKDTVSVEHAVSVLTRVARTEYACTRICDLQSHTDSYVLPLLFSWKTVEVTATAEK